MKASELNAMIELEAISGALEAASFAFADHEHASKAIATANLSIQKALQAWDRSPEQLVAAIAALESIQQPHSNITLLIQTLTAIQEDSSSSSAQGSAYLQNRMAARME